MTINHEEIEKKVIDVLAEKSCVDIEKIHLESSLIDDLGMDSLDSVEAVFQFEEQYNIEIADDEIRELKKVRDIIAYIENRLNKDPKK